MQESDTKSLKYGTRMSLVGIAEILALAVFKAVLGYMTGIVVLIADAINSLGDLLSLFATYIGLKISQRPADKNFQYGYYKAETLAALVTSVIIIYLGVEIMLDSVERIAVMEESRMQYLAIISIIITILATLHLASLLQKTGRKINSIAMEDAGKEKKMDLLVQIGVLVGVAANYFKIPYIEGTVGVIISLVTLKVGYETARESIFFLLDHYKNPELIDAISKIIRSKSHIIRSVKNIRMRRAGTFLFGEAFLEINPHAQIKDLRSQLDNVREEIKKTNPFIKDFLLFVMIPGTAKIKVAVPVKEDRGMESEIAHDFDDTRAYMFIEINNDKITDFYTKPFKFVSRDINDIINYLEGEKVNIVINNDMHSLLYYHLRRLHHIEVYPTFSNVTSAEDAVKLLIIDT